MAKSNKTNQVMRLITGATARNEPKKHIKDAGDRKKRVIPQDEAEKFLPRVPQNPSLRIENGTFEKRLVHIPTELLSEQLMTTLNRFKVCKCDICIAIITEKTIAELPNRFVKIDSPQDETKLKNELDNMRPDFLQKLAKICISAKKQPLHNQP